MSDYDVQNIFARILRGEIPCRKVHETDHSLAFYDVNPRAPVHVLVIPKGAYISSQDFFAHASTTEIKDFAETVTKVASLLGVDQTGYRLIANHGRDAMQEVPHMHLHIMGGQTLGEMLPLMKA